MPAATPPRTYTTRLLTPETWPAFAALVERNNGVWGGCWCLGFHAEAFTTREGNREAKKKRVDAGTVRQILVMEGGDAVGWCQFGPPAEVPSIKNLKAYAKEQVSEPAWRIGCVFTDAKHRGEGVATAAVEGALAAIRAAGGGLVEAYPEQTEGRPEQRGAYLHTGPEELFTRFGFTRDRRIAKWRWVMRLQV